MTASRVDMTHGAKGKAFRAFCWQPVKPRPSRYNVAILKKLAFFLRKPELFCIRLGRSNVFAELEPLLNLGESCDVWGFGLWGSGNGLWLKKKRRPPRKYHCGPPQNVVQAHNVKVGAFSPLAAMHQGRRLSWLRGSFAKPWWKLRRK